MPKLPCVNCGNILFLVKGATAQCLSCGTKNVYYESYDMMSGYVQEVLGIGKFIEKDESQKEIPREKLIERMDLVNKEFSNLLNLTESLPKYVITKISETISQKMLSEVTELSQRYGMLSIVIEFYILPYLEDEISKNQFIECKIVCEVNQLIVLSLKQTMLAKENYLIEQSKELYDRAADNFERAAELAENYMKNNEFLNMEDQILLFMICSDFCRILSNILTENPTHYSDDFEELINRIDALNLNSLKAISLKTDIKEIYDLSNDLPRILEEIRVQNPLKQINTQVDNILYHSEEIIERLDNALLWFSEIEELYKADQTELLKIHSGNFLPYISDFRNEFNVRMKQAKDAYETIIEKIINTTVYDYTLSASDYLEEVENVITIYPLEPHDIVNRLRYIRKDLEELDSDFKEFLFKIMEYGIEHNFKAEHTLTIISSISDKHSSFDRLIQGYIKNLLDKFIVERDEKRFTIDEQKNQFKLKLLPIIENLIKISFTLKEEQIPYPLFIELIILSTQLEVEQEYKVFFVVHNPSNKTLQHVNVTFFVPNSFRIKTRFYEIKKLKPNQTINVETRIIPSKSGNYHFMAMVEYEFSKELYWMPSLQFKLNVLNKEQLKQKLDDDQVLDEIYKKYGRVVNEDELEDGKDLNDEDLGGKSSKLVGVFPIDSKEEKEKLVSNLENKKPKDDLLPDI